MTQAGMVTLIGRPNVGKSTLMNRLVGEKISIITPVPQTTRNRICGIMNLPDGQVVFVDTPGLHHPRTALNRYMVEEALRALQGVDLVLYMIDVTRPDPAVADPEGKSMKRGKPGYREDESILERLQALEVPSILLLNKIDCLANKADLLPLIERYSATVAFEEVIPISAKTGDGVDLVTQQLQTLLPEGEPLFPADILTDRAERFLVAEMIREQVIFLTREEIPYACGVQIDRFDETERTEQEDGLVRMEGTIFVERESQKGILIGKGGSMLKQIGTRARKEIEKLLACRVYLKLWVRVEKNWSQDERALQRLGYE